MKASYQARHVATQSIRDRYGSDVLAVVKDDCGDDQIGSPTRQSIQHSLVAILVKWKHQGTHGAHRQVVFELLNGDQGTFQVHK
jgi:hypothetical protein